MVCCGWKVSDEHERWRGGQRRRKGAACGGGETSDREANDEKLRSKRIKK